MYPKHTLLMGYRTDSRCRTAGREIVNFSLCVPFTMPHVLQHHFSLHVWNAETHCSHRSCIRNANIACIPYPQTYTLKHIPRNVNRTAERLNESMLAVIWIRTAFYSQFTLDADHFESILKLNSIRRINIYRRGFDDNVSGFANGCSGYNLRIMFICILFREVT